MVSCMKSHVTCTEAFGCYIMGFHSLCFLFCFQIDCPLTKFSQFRKAPCRTSQERIHKAEHSYAVCLGDRTGKSNLVKAHSKEKVSVTGRSVDIDPGYMLCLKIPRILAASFDVCAIDLGANSVNHHHGFKIIAARKFWT